MAAITDSFNDDVNYHRLYDQDLPQDLWIEIFIRASVESLRRVKCVCTRWRTLVGNPSFTKKHLEFQKKTSKDKDCFLLQHLDSTEVTSYFLFDVASVANVVTPLSSHNDRHHYSLHNTHSSRQVYIEGPVNGLYCVYGGTDRIVIWNPATKEVSFLPLAGECLPGKFLSYECRDDLIDDYRYISLGKLGFGTDPLNEEDYKVVMICEHDDESGQEEYCRLLYTTGTNTWRIIKDDNFVGFGYVEQYYSNNTFLDGFYYWFEQDRDFVIAFDMGKEIFQKISTPISHSISRCQIDLVVHNDAITLLRVNKELNEIDVWELIARESIWIKKKSVVVEVRGVQASLGFWNKNDEMLIVIGDSEIPMSGEGQTVLYNTTTREITNVGLRGWGHYFKAFVYYESLVSLSGSITKFRGNHNSCLDAIWLFICAYSMQDVVQQLEEV